MKEDTALSISNPRLLSAAYFCLLAVIVTIIIDLIFYALGLTQLIPTFEAIILAALLGAGFGALFGEKIIHCPAPYHYKVFFWGFLMVLAALPFYDLVFLYLLNKYHPKILEGLSYGNLFLTYLFVIFYSLLLAGLWLALAAGFAAIYLRGQIVYNILDSKNDKLKELPRGKASEEESKISPPKNE